MTREKDSNCKQESCHTFSAMLKIVWKHKKVFKLKHSDDRVQTIRYGTRRRHVIDVYLPESQQKKNTKNKCFIISVGSGWMFGSKLFGTPFAYALRKLGYVIFVLDYPRYPSSTIAEQINDVTNALSYITKEETLERFNINENHINIATYSAAGHIVIHSFLKRLKEINNRNENNGKVSWKPCDFNSCFICSCPCNLIQVFETNGHHFAIRNALNKMFNIKQKYDKNFSNLSSNSQIAKHCMTRQVTNMIENQDIDSKDLCPIHIVNGNRDTTCTFESAQQFHDVLKSSGFDSSLYRINGWGHLDYAYQDIEPLTTQAHSILNGLPFCWNDFNVVE